MGDNDRDPGNRRVLSVVEPRLKSSYNGNRPKSKGIMKTFRHHATLSMCVSERGTSELTSTLSVDKTGDASPIICSTTITKRSSDTFTTDTGSRGHDSQKPPRVRRSEGCRWGCRWLVVVEVMVVGVA